MKNCFKCQQNKPLEQFYKHPQMSDGHLNKCKSCTKEDVSKNYRERKEYYVEFYREREHRPERKKQRADHRRQYRKRYPEKKRAHAAVNNAIRDKRLFRQPCEVCGTTKGVEGHHEDYNQPLKVRWLCFADHRAEHGQDI
jgi:hypothetical protein